MDTTTSFGFGVPLAFMVVGRVGRNGKPSRNYPISSAGGFRMCMNGSLQLPLYNLHQPSL